MLRARYTLTNKNKGIVRLISWGASIQSIKIPNRDGKLADVVLGFDDMDGIHIYKLFAEINVHFLKNIGCV